MKNDLNQEVQTLLDELVASGEEVGLQVAAYLNGELVVDVWAGIADETTGAAVDGETLFTSWSTTKGWVATCLHLLADQGRVDYDAPVATYWPEFAAHGKGAATVRQALMHAVGVPHLPDDVTPEMMTDWDAMCATIAAHAPLWTPGTQSGYHAWTFGWIIGELVRRIDGRPIARFAREELCEPLGIEGFYLGIPDSVDHRVALLRQEPQHLAESLHLGELGSRVMPPHVTSAEVVNRPDVRRASIPGGGGIMNARAIARHYAMLACHGSLDGVRILSPERIDLISTSWIDTTDVIFDAPARRGLGYGHGGEPEHGGDIALGRSGDAFGHGGNGGSLGFADPVRKLSFGLTKNLMKAGDDPTMTTAYRVAELIRQHIDRTI